MLRIDFGKVALHIFHYTPFIYLANYLLGCRVWIISGSRN